MPPSGRQGLDFPTLPPLQIPPVQLRFGTIQSGTIERFATNSDAIPSGASAQLDLLARQLRLYRDAEVHIEGHTDSTFTEEYNLDLSLRRARGPRRARAPGVDAARLNPEGRGESELRFPEERTAEVDRH